MERLSMVGKECVVWLHTAPALHPIQQTQAGGVDWRVCFSYWGTPSSPSPGPCCCSASSGGCGQLLNLRLRRNFADSIVVVEQWTSLEECIGCCPLSQHLFDGFGKGLWPCPLACLVGIWVCQDQWAEFLGAAGEWEVSVLVIWHCLSFFLFSGDVISVGLIRP